MIMEPVVYSEFLMNVYIMDTNGFGTTVYQLVAQNWHYSMMDCQLAGTLQQFDPVWGEAKAFVVLCSEHDLTKQMWQLLGGEL